MHWFKQLARLSKKGIALRLNKHVSQESLQYLIQTKWIQKHICQEHSKL